MKKPQEPQGLVADECLPRMWDLILVSQPQRKKSIRSLAVVAGLLEGNSQEPQVQLCLYRLKEKISGSFRLYEGVPLPEYEILICPLASLEWEPVQPCFVQPGQRIEIGGKFCEVRGINFESGEIRVDEDSRWYKVTPDGKAQLASGLDLLFSQGEWVQETLFDLSIFTCLKTERRLRR